MGSGTYLEQFVHCCEGKNKVLAFKREANREFSLLQEMLVSRAKRRGQYDEDAPYWAPVITPPTYPSDRLAPRCGLDMPTVCARSENEE